MIVIRSLLRGWWNAVGLLDLTHSPPPLVAYCDAPAETSLITVVGVSVGFSLQVCRACSARYVGATGICEDIRHQSSFIQKTAFCNTNPTLSESQEDNFRPQDYYLRLQDSPFYEDNGHDSEPSNL